MKNVIISGASRGIGRACATEFAKNGYNLALCCNTEIELLNNLYKELDNYNIQIIHDNFDIKNNLLCKEFIEKVYDKFNTVDILINNAGISHIGLMQDMSYEEWDNIIRTNLYSVFNMTSACIPNMIKNKSGKIINISSIWGKEGASCEVAYSTSKGAINSFTKALAKELAPSSIEVNAVALGLIDTDMNKCFSKDELSLFIEDIPKNRMATSSEAAEFIYKIANMSDYFTGQIINFDGGLY